jgi:ribosomal peptide maturation radical SAM protein 1
VSGEADVAFPALLIALAEVGDVSGVPGVVFRQGAEVIEGPPVTPIENLDDLPVPEYGEYFRRANGLGLLPRDGVLSFEIPFESARGCWWGEKKQCTFCGLNGTTMRFRSKSPGRVTRELAELTRRHGSFAFAAADNILDPSYLEDLMEPLARSGATYSIFYEVKANLRREQLASLYRAGVRELQPGVESLSTHVLALMKKGTRASQNVNILRWARYYGIDLTWNLLWGFPNETDEDYFEQVRLMRWLHYLQPPLSWGRIGIERFSPYFEDRDQLKYRVPCRPMSEYAMVYPPTTDLEAAVYHFEGELASSISGATARVVHNATQKWRARWERQPRPSLVYWWAPGVLRIEDNRRLHTSTTWSFVDPAAAIYVALSERPATAGEVAHETHAPAGEIEAALTQFVERGLMMRDGSLYLSLAIPATSVDRSRRAGTPTACADT